MLSADKQYLVESRLTPARPQGRHRRRSANWCRSSGAATRRLTVEVVEAMTTNEFVLLPRQDSVRSFPRRDHAGPAGRARQGAAHAHLVRGGLDRAGALFARDVPEGDEGQARAAGASRFSRPIISTEVLEKAKAGIYSQFEVQRGLPITMLVKYFTQTGDTWQIAPEIRAMVQYRPLNLLPDFSSLGSFDVVFCRNVLIYFDQDTKISVLNRIARVLEPDGYPGARRCRNRGRPDRRVQAGARQARPLCAEQGCEQAYRSRRGHADPSARRRGRALIPI